MVAPALALVVALFYPFVLKPMIQERTQAPESYKMRAYVLSRLSDQQVIDLHEKAARDFEEHKRKQAEEGKQFWEGLRQQQVACESNPAAKLRDPNHCLMPLPLGYEDVGKPSYGWETADKFFEAYVMGRCIYASTVHEAKSLGCLPQ
jgi:hypothetical protein